MRRKNPWIAGLLNVLIPGLGWLYTHGLLRFIVHLILNGVIGVAFLLVANLLLAPILGMDVLEGTNASPQSIQSTAIGIMGLLYVLMLFSEGYGSARSRNRKLAASAGEAQKLQEQESLEAKLRRLQELASAGLITQEDYEAKKADLLDEM